MKFLLEKVNLDNIPEENKHGNCFLVASDYVMHHPKATLVHGIVTGQGPIEGLQYNHAWAEEDGLVIDNTINLTCPQLLYYLLGHIEITYKYSYEDMLKNFSKNETYGPWENELWQYP